MKSPLNFLYFSAFRVPYVAHAARFDADAKFKGSRGYRISEIELPIAAKGEGRKISIAETQS